MVWRKNALALLSLIVCFSIAEMVVPSVNIGNSRSWGEKSNYLGWDNKEKYNSDGVSVSDRRRTTGSSSSEDRIVFLGGSFTFGYGLEDKQTFSYLVQNEVKEKIENYGVCGHGTVQALYKLKRINFDGVKAIYYFYIWHHENRNVGSRGWLNSGGVRKNVPFIDSNMNYSYAINWLPFSESLNLLSVASVAIDNFCRSYANKVEATKKAVKDMALICQSEGIPFSFINLHALKKSRSKMWGVYCESIGVRYANLTLSSTSFYLPNDNHPNEFGHRIYADWLIYDIKRRDSWSF